MHIQVNTKRKRERRGKKSARPQKLTNTNVQKHAARAKKEQIQCRAHTPDNGECECMYGEKKKKRANNLAGILKIIFFS